MSIKKTILHILLISILISLISAPSFGGEVTYDKLLERSREINNGLKTFKATVKINALFMGVKFPFYGRLYYKKPNKLRLSIPGVPPALKGKQGLFKEAVPRSFSSEDYNGKILKDAKLNKTVNCYLLELHPKKPGKIKTVYIWVDKKSCLTPRTKIYYNDKSVITSLQSYRREDGFIMPDKQRIEFDFPKFRASAIVDYKKYDINVPVDEYFKKKDDETANQ